MCESVGDGICLGRFRVIFGEGRILPTLLRGGRTDANTLKREMSACWCMGSAGNRLVDI